MMASAQVCYKDSQATQKLDPVADEWTGVWRDGRDINPLGAMPENSLTGQLYVSDTWANFPIIVPPEYGSEPHDNRRRLGCIYFVQECQQ